MIERLARVTLVLWAGGLWSLAWVTYTLFHAQPDRQLAGRLAGPLFSFEAYVGVVAALLALLRPGRSKFRWGYIAAALLACNEWLLRPLMNAARTHGTAAHLTFNAWHGVSMSLYLVACIAVLIMVWRGELP